MFSFYKTTIGKKIVMAVTGFFLLLFVIGHMIGNLKVFKGNDPHTGRPMLDVYGDFLREAGHPLFGHGELLWIARIGLLVLVTLHILSAVLVTSANLAARPVGYSQRDYSTTTYAARTMWMGGIIIALYVVYHLLHMTTGTLHFQGFEHGKVYANVTSTFRVWYVSLIYVVAMLALCLHIYHGLWSACQTLGINIPRYNKILRNASKLIAIVIFVGYVSVPAAVFFGLIP